ncbi:MAG: exodeoxyribonuclease VII small subunit [Alphaproteobacteria bacterium]|nr:exodeoxyribonuclease VII small subunit [Alphaproteobacteria bacterium]MBR1480065.1 exodeoxyribonuclease VII small subunit [Alphaproteobacteria bacterium]
MVAGVGLEELTFEQAVAELEEIIKKLEEGKIPLDEAVGAFERGTMLKKICEDKLKNAQLKIEMLSDKGE